MPFIMTDQPHYRENELRATCGVVWCGVVDYCGAITPPSLLMLKMLLKFQQSNDRCHNLYKTLLTFAAVVKT